MKVCKDVVPLLSPHADGALAADDRGWVDEHLAGCASCRARLALFAAQAQALRERLATRAAAADFTGFSDAVLRRVRAGQRPAPLDRLRAWGSELWGAHTRAFAAAGGLAAAAGLALAVLLAPAAPPDGRTMVANAQVDEVDFGTHDGAVMQLPRDTTLIWLSDDRTARK